ncbi:MAG: DUF2100 domain-containing protein [Candidatus Hodarchaeota archaeon]
MKHKITSEEVKAILAAIDSLIDIKILIRKIAPNYDLDDKLNKKFLNLLKMLNLELQPLFHKYLLNSFEIEKDKILSKSDVTDLIKKENIIIISASYLKKKLKNFGVDPRNLIVTGGPLFVENYKKLNPTLSDEALSNIKKRSEHLLNLIEKFAKTENKIIFLYEKDNLTDLIILEELDLLEKKINRKIEIYKMKS